jgi:hypothetical protein
VRTFDNNKGYKIIDLVYRHQVIGLGFRELQRKTGFHSRNTLDMWLKRLRNLGFISYPKKPIRLTEAAVQKYENGSLALPSFFRSNRAAKTQKNRLINDKKAKQDPEKRQNAYLLILSIAAFGATYYRRTSKYKSGQIVGRDRYKKKKINYSSYERPGVGLVDLVDKHRTRLAYLPPRRKNIGNDELFGYISLTKSESQQYTNELQDHDPSILHLINPQLNGITRYDISDPLLKEFIAFCIITLGDVEQRMHYAWLYKRPMEDDEKKWYMRLYGKEAKGTRITNYFLSLVERKGEFRKKEKKIQDELSSHADKVIHEFDKSIKHGYHIIMSQKYLSTRKRYSLVTEPLIEVVYPYFLKTEYHLA